MRRLLFLSTAIILSLQMMANSLGKINETCWHDGNASFIAMEKNGVIEFQGGTLHEGGYGFKVVKGRGGKLVVLSIYEESNISTLSGRSVSGSTIERRNIDGKDLLIIKSPKGTVTDVLFRLEGGFSSVLEEQLNQQLDGVYRSRNGSEFAFDGEGRMSIGTAHDRWESYSFVEIYDTPSNILSVFRGRDHFEFDFEQHYLKLDVVKTKNGMAWDDDPEVETVKSMKLKKIKGVRYKGEGIWPITSVEILSSGYLEIYDAETLRLMRNDIYARHGYRFKNKALFKTFKEQLWYKPFTSDASSLKLNEIERINLALIQNMEKIKSQDD